MLDPRPGSPQELERFAALQSRLGPLFLRVLPDPLAPRTVIVIPALSLDRELLSNVLGIRHYEERLLCMLMLLRLPRTRVVYVTSTPVDPTIVDYYVHLLPGIPSLHARSRLHMISCYDGSARATVTEKILARPRLLQRIRRAVGDPEDAHMTCFHATPWERTLAVQLGVPLFANDPDLAHLGTKSGSREIFREAGVSMPEGREHLRDEQDVVAALTELRRRLPEVHRAAIKLEEGTSGEGNALFTFSDCPDGSGAETWIRRELPRGLRFANGTESWESFRAKFARCGGVVERWIHGRRKRSPSVQGRITPDRRVTLISTHDQVLGGPSGQVFLGASFPADEDYRLEIQEIGLRVGKVLEGRGALGRYGVDFVSVKDGDGWRHFAIEINLRKGGTTHTFRLLQFLTDGTFDPASGLYRTSSGEPRYYHASDNLCNEAYKRLTPDDLMDIAAEHDLHFHAATQCGIFFHLIGALSEHGKLGLVSVCKTADGALERFQETIAVLDQEARR
jgi:hypothetical protein